MYIATFTVYQEHKRTFLGPLFNLHSCLFLYFGWTAVQPMFFWMLQQHRDECTVFKDALIHDLNANATFLFKFISAGLFKEFGKCFKLYACAKANKKHLTNMCLEITFFYSQTSCCYIHKKEWRFE